MRNETEVLDELVRWGRATAGIRGMVLTSSRAALNAQPDFLSDFDIEIAVTDRSRFKEAVHLLSGPETILHLFAEDHEDYSMRLVLYKDYVRIDYTIYETGHLEKCRAAAALPIHWNLGYNVLVDKDQLYTGLPAPDRSQFYIRKPSEAAFTALVNDFWWDLPYVAKSLWRNELFYARYMLDAVIRSRYLLTMIEWHIGSNQEWIVSANKSGRCFEQLLDETTMAGLRSTYANSDPDANWDALFAMADLFNQLAEALGNRLQYPYPLEMAMAVQLYLRKIRETSRD